MKHSNRTSYISFRTQTLVLSLLITILPSIVLGIFASMRSIQEVLDNTDTFFLSSLQQADTQLDNILLNASKVTELPLLNNDIRRAMFCNYEEDYLSYANDNSMVQHCLQLANRVNSDLLTCVFSNKYDYVFDYNVRNYQHLQQIMQNIEECSSLTADSQQNRYIAPIHTATYANQSYLVIPVIKEIIDGYTYKNIGTCYIEINVRDVEKMLKESDNRYGIYFYDADGVELYESGTSDLTQNRALEQEVNKFQAGLTEEAGHSSVAAGQDPAGSSVNLTLRSCNFSLENRSYILVGCINETTGWRLVKVVDITNMTAASYQAVFWNYLPMTLPCLLLGILLSFLLSYRISRPIAQISSALDAQTADHYAIIDENLCRNTAELHCLVRSFNEQNRHLEESLRKGYEVQLQEQKSRHQMLQFQINHHFLYNTLNIISSLAQIHNVPEIWTVAINMSELLRYGLRKSPISTLGEELEQVMRYMDIQKIRFPNKYTFDCSVPKERYPVPLPVFTLQPLVENAIEHAFARMENGCYISVSCQTEADTLHIYVTDNGCGIPSDALAVLNDPAGHIQTANSGAASPGHHSLGIQNIRQRIQTYCGTDYGIAFDSEMNSGTIAEITVPLTPREPMNPGT